MSITVNEQILNIVKRIKEQAKIAEDTFDKRSRELEKSCENNIDLLGGSVTNRVAEIARESKQTCDDLYTTYQMLVIMLDKECRPLLEQKPDVQSVNEVQKTIAWLNSESEIENNFAASLNKHNLGNLVTVNYYASLENKMIQKFWEQTFRAMPGAEKIIKKEEKEKAEAKKRKKDAEKFLRELTMSGGGETTLSSEQSTSSKSNKDNNVASVLNKIKERINEYNCRISDEEKRRDETVKDIRARSREWSNEILNLQTKRNNLGIFKGKEKKAINEQILKLQGDVVESQKKIEYTIRQKDNHIEMLRKCRGKYINNRKLISPKEGDIVEFGTDPLSIQFNPESKISWIVVKVTDENMYLFSQKVLACCKYNNDGYDYFEDNALSYPDWLTMFEEKAFSPEEKKLLAKSPLDEYKYAYVYTKTDATQLPEKYLNTTVTETVKKQVDSIERFRDSDKERRINNLNSTYWLHSYVLWDDTTVHRMKLNDDGKWVAWTDQRVYNGEFRLGMRPAIILKRKKLTEYIKKIT